MVGNSYLGITSGLLVIHEQRLANLNLSRNGGTEIEKLGVATQFDPAGRH